MRLALTAGRMVPGAAAPCPLEPAAEFSRSEGRAGVLKITRRSGKGQVPTVQLEGEVLGPWVDAVRDACAKRGGRSRRLRLDLAAVTYADAAGVRLLRDLLSEGIEIAACSNFLTELLHLDD